MSIITLNNISKRYGEKTILDNYNLSVEKGEFLCIMGRSGSGKTTLLNIIGLLESPDSGSIEVCGEINPRLNSRKGRNLLRYKLSYLFQDYGLIENRSVEYNISISAKYISNKGDMKKKIKRVLHDVGLDGFEKRKVFQLSGGEQQRVALAKILMRPSEIILADEPTGSLDDANKEQVLSIIKELHKRGMTIIMVSHDNIVKEYAERIENL